MCCFASPDLTKMTDKFNIEMSETEKGIRIDVEPKDKTKADSLKNLLKACEDFCDCDCIKS